VTRIKCELEIDHDRGVIYVHTLEGPLAGVTVLRVCNLDKPIPRNAKTQIDVKADTTMYSVVR
jgi:hypothetical protein